jgi:hypothetical protein
MGALLNWASFAGCGEYSNAKVQIRFMRFIPSMYTLTGMF